MFAYMCIFTFLYNFKDNSCLQIQNLIYIYIYIYPINDLCQGFVRLLDLLVCVSLRNSSVFMFYVPFLTH